MLTNEHEGCRIGQKDRCGSTGCEWKKVFGNSCSVIDKPEIKFVPAEDIKPFFTKKKKKKKVKVINNIVMIKKTKEIDFSNKITIAEQDNWIKKIKTI